MISWRSAPIKPSAVALLVLACVLMSFGCRARSPKGLGDQPPGVDANTKILGAFDPAALTGPRASGLALDAAVAGPPQPPEPPPLPDPEVVDYGPTGEASQYPTIQVRFNRPMMALGAKQRVSADQAGFRIEPAIEGEAYWAEPTRLVFEPTTELPLATEYKVSFDSKIASVDGPELDVNLAWSFATQAPRVDMRADYDAAMDNGSRDEYHWKAAVALNSDHDLKLATLRKHLSVTARGSSGKAVAVDVRVKEVKADRYGYREPQFLIAPTTRWPADSEIVVTVDKRLTGTQGPRPIGYPSVYSFRTAAGVEAVARSCVEGEYVDGCELGPVVVRFSAPITRAQAKRLSISPKPPGFDTLAVDRGYDDDQDARNAYHAVMLWGEFQRGTSYTISVDDKLRDVHGQALVGERSFELEFIEPPPVLALHRASGTFMDALGAKLGIESRYVETLRVRVAVLDDATHERLIDDDVQQDGWPSGLEPTHEQPITLTHTGKFGWSSDALDLGQFSGGKPAAMLVEVVADSLVAGATGRRRPASQRGLVQFTNLGITAVGSVPGGVVRVARLSDGKPVAGAQVELIHAPGDKAVTLGKTDADGLVKLPSAAEFGEHSLVRARKGDDQILLEIASLRAGGEPVSKLLRVGESVRTTVMTERPLYKPGERVRVMGWSAIATPHELSGLRRLPGKTRVALELRDFRDEVVATATVRAKDHGKFWATLQVPETAALGDYELTAKLLGSQTGTTLQVKDFPVPEFEVTAEASRTDIHGGESTSIAVNASYYFGGRVPIKTKRQTTDCDEVDYRPPGLDPSFSVAPRRSYRYGYGYGHGHVPTLRLGSDPQAANGHLEYDISLSTGVNGQTRRCTHSVAVSDISEKAIGAETNIWVHPAFYLAANAPRMIEAGEAAEVAIQTLDFDGKPLAVADIKVTLKRSWSEPEYVKENGKRRYAGQRWRERTLPVCKTDSEGAAACSFAALEYGHYTIEVETKRGGYAPVVTRGLYVRKKYGSAWSQVPVKQLTVEVDQPKPVPGQTIHARVQAPWLAGSGLILLSKGGLHELRTFTLDQGAAEIAFEVTDAWIPGAELHVVAVEPGDTSKTPALRTAQTEVSIASDPRQLAVSVDVQAEAQTRERIPIEVRVRDQFGQPVRGHVSVWAVDEAVLSLAPLVLPDFASNFVVGFKGGLDIVSGYAALLLPFVTRPDPYEPLAFDPNWTRDWGWGSGYGSGSGSGYGGGGGRGAGGMGASGSGMPPARSKFESAPIFIADAELDEHGVARVQGELPDNLTTFRLTAVASAPLASGPVEARFGTGDARVRVTRPLVVRAVMPRIMRPGDLAEVGVVVDNLRGGAGTVNLEFVLHGAEGILDPLDKPIAKASIEAGGQLRVPFRIRALTTGEPELEVRAVLRPSAAKGKRVSDSLRLPLPVEPERTLTDRVAVYGSLADDGAALLPFVIPSDADPKFGGLSVSVGSTLLGGLEDAVAYLVKYPYGCLEQTSSSLLPLIPLGRLAKDYPLGIDNVDSYVDVGISRLRAMQLANGGFSYWPGGTEPAPYPSAYATWVLGQAAAAGYRVPAAMLAKADGYLLGMVDEWQDVTGPTTGQDIEVALMLSTLAERGKAPSAALTTLYERRGRLPVFSQATLLLALETNAAATQVEDPRVKELLRELTSLVDEREAVAKVELTKRWTWYWDSGPRSSAIVLMALLRADPMHPLASKLTRGLLEERRGGRWSNTQENAYALLALADYAAIYEAEEPRFDGRVWLGNTALASVHVEGRKFNFEDGFTAMNDLLTAAHGVDDRLILERAGQGRMYYRVGLEWASTAIDKPAKAEGIRLTRVLRSGDGIIGEDQAVASGDLLAIDVQLEIPAALDHVAIEIPLPAGIEAVDLELGKGSAAMKLSGNRGYWVSHQELRRDRAVLFADHLEPGKHRTTVFLRATTPGEYVMPAGHAEMMYYPEVYGRTTGRRLIVH